MRRQTFASRRLQARRALMFCCALSLALSTLWLPFASAQQGGARSQKTAKRALTHQDYDSWRSIQGQTLSRDGKFVAYAAVPQDGDGEIIVRNLASGTEWRAPRGWRPPAPPPSADGGEPTAGPPGLAVSAATRPRFTADSRFAIFTIEPNKADVLKARKEKKAPDAMPKNALGIMDLSSEKGGQVTRIERVKNFQVPEDGAGWVAYALEAKAGEARPEEKKPEEKAAPPNQPPNQSNEDAEEDFQQRRGAGTGAAGSRPGGARKEYGTDLVLKNLVNGSERTFADALDYSFSKDAKSLVFTVSSRKEETNGVYVATPGPNLNDAVSADLLTGKGKYSKLTWDEEQTQMAFASDRDDAAAKQPKSKLYHWKRGDAKAMEIISTATPGFRSGLVISERGAINFSQDGSRLLFGIAPPPEPEKDPNDAVADEDKVSVDLWHWKDDFIQPMQKVRAEADRNRSYRAIYQIKKQKLTQLADETMQNINLSASGQWAVGMDDRAYRQLVGVDTNYSDIYLVNTEDAARKLLLKRFQSGVSFSPSGKYTVFFDGKDWGSISIPDGKVTNLTKDLPAKFWREDTDTPSTPGSYGNGGWVKSDKYVLLYDKYDIWQIAPDGTSAKNLTDGAGRKEKTTFRYVRMEQDRGEEPGERGIDPSKPLLLSADNEWTRESGFYRDRIDGSVAPEKLLMAAKSFSPPVKAKDADIYMLTASRFDEFPDLVVTDGSFKTLKKVSEVGKQKDQFTWGRSELIRYKNSDGVALSGMLIKPENFDPKQKYPMMVYIYEKLSQNLNRFVTPAPGTSINAAFYASNGYLVLMPDIVYTVGYPGQSALKCVLPAIQAVADHGFVNEDAIGIQGHSWGGYQIAYMVTQTNRFKAAAPGALVANMTSAYSGIRWG
ncbi:MAG: prolyl oligopeptidase family serine peptidase, partial [Acidobacteriota bacterium]|nr:prolyl oligopeptidase family serine peptidase [Acidobacteriota bacterium]